LVGIDPATDFTIKPWLSDFSGELKDNEIILGSNAHVFLGKSESHVGDKELFYGREFTVAGIMDPIGIGLDDAGFVSLNTVYQMAAFKEPTAVLKLDIQPGQISSLMVKVKPDVSRADMAVRIEQEVPSVRVVTSRELASSSVSRQLESLTPGLILIGIGFWAISVLMIGALFSMIVNERRRELGLLQAMGATRAFIFRLVMLEAVELTFVGGVLGLLIGGALILGLTGPVAGSLGIAYIWPGAMFVGGFLLLFGVMSVITGMLAALYPALVASRLEPYEAIRTGE
jgi:putative ABC transport system permease protein